MKTFARRSGCLGKGALKRKAKRRRGLPVMRGLAACALGIAVMAMLGAAPTDPVADDPAALPELSADDGQVTVTVPTEVPCVMLGDGSVIGPATWSIENKSGKAARLANVHAERKAESVEASAETKNGTALLDVSPASATFNQGFELDAGASADVAWSSAISFRQMLYGCSSLKEVDLSGFKTGKARTFASMLNGCSSLERVDVTGFDLSSAQDLSMFFFNCKSLVEADLATTGMSKVTTLYGAFGGCSSLRSVDVSALDVASVTNFAYCFSNCGKLERLDLSGWDASSARDLNHFLSGCASLAELDLSGLHTEGVTDFSYFLYGCKSLKELDFTGISTASASSGYGMFSGMSSLSSVRLGAAFSWVGDAYLPLPSAAGVPGTDGKWHSLTSGKAYLPADVPCGVEDSIRHCRRRRGRPRRPWSLKRGKPQETQRPATTSSTHTNSRRPTVPSHVRRESK